MTLYQQPWPAEGDGFRFFQLGFVVDDVVRAAGRWASVFGVGPFHVLPPADVPCTYRGAETGVALQVGVAQAGPVQIELIEQRCDRPSVFRELATPTGFHQLCTVTPDHDGTVASYLERGFAVACELGGPQRVTYVDTYAEFGFFTEVVAAEPRFLAQLGAISRTCAAWDGSTDPVRLLTRDGYRVP